MNAIILAAGKGSRMRKDGYSTPKPLLPILGVPNLERTVWMLHEFGIEDITVLCNSEFLSNTDSCKKDIVVISCIILFTEIHYIP